MSMSTTIGATAIGIMAVGLYVHQPAARPPEAEAVIRPAVREGDGTSWKAHLGVVLAGSAVTVDEEVTLADDGTLVQAYTSVREGEAEIRTWYEPRASLVTTESGGVVHHEHVADGPAPWVYGPVRTPRGETIGTPLAAWATYRAAEHHAELRRVAPDGSALVPVDQLVVPAEDDLRIVLVGDDAFDLRRDGVEALHLHGPNLSLVRSDRGDAWLHFRAPHAAPAA